MTMASSAWRRGPTNGVDLAARSSRMPIGGCERIASLIARTAEANPAIRTSGAPTNRPAPGVVLYPRPWIGPTNTCSTHKLRLLARSARGVRVHLPQGRSRRRTRRVTSCAPGLPQAEPRRSHRPGGEALHVLVHTPYFAGRITIWGRPLIPEYRKVHPEEAGDGRAGLPELGANASRVEERLTPAGYSRSLPRLERARSTALASPRPLTPRGRSRPAQPQSGRGPACIWRAARRIRGPGMPMVLVMSGVDRGPIRWNADLGAKYRNPKSEIRNKHEIPKSEIPKRASGMRRRSNRETLPPGSSRNFRERYLPPLPAEATSTASACSRAGSLPELSDCAGHRS